MNRLRLFALVLPLLAGLARAEIQPVESLREAALSTVPDRAAPGVQAEAAVDAALRLPACARPLQAQAGTGGVAEVACPGNWRLYIPVRVRRLAPVLVVVRAVAAGQPLPAEALRVESRDVSRLPPGSYADAGAVGGRVARRALAAGAVVTADDLVAARLLRRGDPVTLVARSGSVEVRMSGRALGEAGLGEPVRVENTGSGRVLQGILVAPGEVRLP